MAQPVPDWYLPAIAQHHGVRTRITQIDWDRREIRELTDENASPGFVVPGFGRVGAQDGALLGGSITLSRLSLPAATLNATIANPGGLWTPRAIGDAFQIGSLLKIERGIVAPQGSIRFTQMIAYVDRPQVQVTADDNVLSIQASDLWSLFVAKQSRTVLTFERGQGVGHAIRTIALLAGWPSGDQWFDFSDDRQVFDTPRSYPAYTLLPDLMLQIAADYALELRPRYDGTLLLQPAPTVTSALTPVRTYQPGETSTLLAVTKGLGKGNLHNAVEVEGQSHYLGRVVRGSARDLNPASPTYNPPPGLDPAWPNGGGPMGDLLMGPIRSAGITTEAQARRKAEQLLFEACLFEETHDWSFVNDPSVLVGDPVFLGEPTSDTSGVELLDQISQDLSAGEGNDSSEVSSKRMRTLVAA